MGTAMVGKLTIALNLGAIVGGLIFGAWSQRIGRRRAITAAALLALPMIPLWAYGGSVVMLGLGAFGLQVMVQGAWGIVPVHLNELCPSGARATLPGFVYQIGNFLASGTATLLTWYAAQRNGDFAFAMASFIALVAIVLALLSFFGPEAKGTSLD